MFKNILLGLKNIFSGVKTSASSLASKLGKYVPTCVKKGIKQVTTETLSLRDKVLDNYTSGVTLAQMQRKTGVYSVASGMKSVLSTEITKADVPALFGVIGMCSPIPCGNSIGYVAGKILVSKPVTKTLSSGKKAITSTYNTVGNLFRV